MRRFVFPIFVFLMLITSSSALAQSEYGYAYLAVLQDQTVELRIIDPANADAVTEVNAYNPPAGWLPPSRNGFASPDGEWVTFTLFSVDQQNLMVQLYNLNTGETREIAQGSIYTLTRSINWSPDSQYLALALAQNAGDFDLLIYNVASDVLTNITDDDLDQFDIGWSSDSTQIVTFTKVCTDISACQGRLDLYAISTFNRLNSIDLPLNYGSSVACELIMSPDTTHVAFASRCSDLPEIVSDIYVWSITDGNLSQVINLSGNDVNGVPVFVDYHLEWLDVDALIVGADYQVFGSDPQNTLILYNAEEQTTSTLSTSVGTNFAISQIDQTLAAFVAESQNNTGQVEFQDLGTLELIEQGDIRPSDSDISSRVNQACDLQYSPNGIDVAFLIFGTDDCQGEVVAFGFAAENTRSDQSHVHTIASIETIQSIVPIGWVQMR